MSFVGLNPTPSSIIKVVNMWAWESLVNPPVLGTGNRAFKSHRPHHDMVY